MRFEKRNETMKQGALFKLVLIWLFAAAAVPAQTRPYAKFGPSGETIGLFNLLKDTSGCEKWQSFTGRIVSVHVVLRRKDAEYQFTVRSNPTTFNFGFKLEKDEIPFRDVENLLGKNRTIKIRACRNGNRDWAVEEVVRTQ